MKLLYITLFSASSLLLSTNTLASNQLLAQPEQVAQLTQDLQLAIKTQLNAFNSDHLTTPADFHLVYIPNQGITITFGELIWKELDNQVEDSPPSDFRSPKNQASQNQQIPDAKLQAYQQLIEKAKANSHQAFAVREQSRKLSEQRKSADEQEKNRLDESLSQLRDQASIAEKQRLEIQEQLKQLDYRPHELVDPEIKSRITKQQNQSSFESLVSSVLTVSCDSALKGFNHAPHESITIVFEKPLFKEAKKTSVVGYTQILNQIQTCDQSDNPFNWYQSFSY